MINTQTPSLILNKRKIILGETIKYVRLATGNEGDLKFCFVHKTTVNEPYPFVVSPQQLTAT